MFKVAGSKKQKQNKKKLKKILKREGENIIIII